MSIGMWTHLAKENLYTVWFYSTDPKTRRVPSRFSKTRRNFEFRFEFQKLDETSPTRIRIIRQNFEFQKLDETSTSDPLFEIDKKSRYELFDKCLASIISKNYEIIFNDNFKVKV